MSLNGIGVNKNCPTRALRQAELTLVTKLLRCDVIFVAQRCGIVPRVALRHINANPPAPFLAGCNASVSRRR